MRRIVVVCTLAFLVIAVLITFKRDTSSKTVSPAVSPTNIISPTNNKSIPRRSLFVPYWTMQNSAIPFSNDTLIYFGISATTDGINTKDQGYMMLDTFILQASTDRKKLLTLRLLDSETNFILLENTSLGEKVISETVVLAKEKGFDGVILDLELSALPFDSLIKQISQFNKKFVQKAHAEDLSFATAIYGDVFYRIRPFDVKTLAKTADTIYIMAYDLHKAKGNPGPNFPLNGAEKYGYDFTTMLDNYLSVAPAEKISVIFGYFGYDWTVNEKNVAISTGKARTLMDIESHFITTCQFATCQYKRDPESAEIMIDYTTESGEKHIIWFEDTESARKKQEFLKSKGINNFSSWAHSYF